MTHAATFVCLGEVLLRLGAVQGSMLLQRPLIAFVGGAETNVAVSLACLGHASRLVSVLPDNALGAAALSEIRRHGVDTSAIAWGEGRMGLYFLTPGHGYKPAEVLYDRQGSAFALSSADLADWEAVLRGVSWLHVSGVTPALSVNAAKSTLKAMHAARAHGVSVSFDCNYRPKLWAQSSRAAADVLREIIESVDLLFASDRDVSMLLGAQSSAGSMSARFHAAAARAFEAFPRLHHVATTFRHYHTADDQELSGAIANRDDVFVSRSYRLLTAIDRIGSGDAFAAGILHALQTGLGLAHGVEFGVAAACLKHSIAGDFNLSGEKSVHELLGEGGFDVRR